MPKTIKVATIQMDANPASLDERLERSEKIITQAAQDGAQLIILPELFNTGYAYSEDNFSLAEPMDGRTSSWMKAVASRLNIHLAGAFLLLDEGEIYDTLLLFSPSGRHWRYDKNYPWAWERGYFRERRGITVAHTELGDLGMLICWDVAHRNLWKQYAGQVDMMVISSCPPDTPNASFQFTDGSQINFGELGSIMDSTRGLSQQAFGRMIDQQAKWLGVPAANSGGSGSIRTNIPRARSLVFSLFPIAPRLIKQLDNADQLQMLSNMVESCKIVDAKGQVLANPTQSDGEGYTMADVELHSQKPRADKNQPKSPLNIFAYLASDVILPWMMRSVYRKGIRKIKSGRNI